MKEMYVYIASSISRTLYVGVTNNIDRRMTEHKSKSIAGFTSKYNITRLVYVEVFNDPMAAIQAEKKIKGWSRSKKIALIEEYNPTWDDLCSRDSSQAPSLRSGLPSVGSE